MNQQRPRSKELRASGLYAWHYVYHLVDPRSGDVFYVGKGRGDRMWQHDFEAARGLLTEKCERIREIWAAGHEVERRIVGLFKQHVSAILFEGEQAEIVGHELAIRGRRLLTGKTLPTVQWPRTT